jgi:D-alanyl-D-alanine carboxypeptidase
MRTANYTVKTSRRTINIHSTNRLVMEKLDGMDVMGGKTGFITKAGYCLATLLRLPQGNQVAVVVLGAQSNPGRFWETRHLFSWLSEKASVIFGKESAELQQVSR